MSRDRAKSLADAASGESVTVDALMESAGDGPLYRSVPEDEQPHYLLRGSICDTVDREMPDSAGDRRRRKVADPGSDLFTVVTDRRVLILVPRSEGFERITIPLEEVSATRVETAPGGNSRLLIETGETAYHIDSSGSAPEAVEGAREFVNDRTTARAATQNSASETPLDSLERLAELHEQGVVTDAEFQEKKRELLDRI